MVGRYCNILLLVVLEVALIEISEATNRNGSFRRRQPAATNSTDASRCPPRRRPCTKDCGTLGFMESEDGCPLCACKARLDCPQLECPVFEPVCLFGRQQDEKGCMLCECNEPGRCAGRSPAVCSEECPLGYRNGSDNCPMCQCVESPTTSSPRRRYRKHSRHHHRRHHHHHRHHGLRHETDHDDNGDNDDDAQPTAPLTINTSEDGETRQVGRRGYWSSRHGTDRRRGYRCGRQQTCVLSCPNGFKRDHKGCALCECNTDVTALPGKTETPILCPEVHCNHQKKCEHGFAVDKVSGCRRPTCECHEQHKQQEQWSVEYNRRVR